jgi:glutamine cyclotransferase
MGTRKPANNNSNKKKSQPKTEPNKYQSPSSNMPLPFSISANKMFIIWSSLACAALATAFGVVVKQQIQRSGTITSTPPSANAEISPSPTEKFDLDKEESKQDKLVVANMGEYYKVLEVIAHDPQAFTQGLEYDPLHGYFVESTGGYGTSDVRLWKTDGTLVNQHKLDEKYFGEGLCVYHNATSKFHPERILQLTWKEQTAFIYDLKTLELLEEFSYKTSTSEGWGIAYDAERHEFYVSDGSEYIHVWNADTLEELRKFPVTWRRHITDDSRTSQHLNELEWDAQTRTLLANVWYQNVILRIDPMAGQVLTIYDFTELYPMADRTPQSDCLNGIAWANRDNGEVWVTGKWWPHMYRVQLLA